MELGGAGTGREDVTGPDLGPGQPHPGDRDPLQVVQKDQSARYPGATAPLPCSRKYRAVFAVAMATAVTGGTPRAMARRTSSSMWPFVLSPRDRGRR